MLAQFYPPVIGGEERHVHELSKELVQRGHTVTVATFGQQRAIQVQQDEGVRIYRIPSTTQRTMWLYQERQRPHAPPFPDPEALLALYRVIAWEQPHIVHAHNWLLHSFLPLKRWSNARLIVSLHDYSLRCVKKRLMYQGASCSGPGVIKCVRCAVDHYGAVKGVPTVLAHWAMGSVERTAVDMFLPVSCAVAIGNGLSESNAPFRIIPNFVPDVPENDNPGDAARLALLPPDGYLLFVGDLSRDKGVDVLLRAYAGLTNVPPLVLIGQNYLSLSTASLPPNVVVFDGWPHTAVMEAWRRCSIALVPSVWPEPFGIVVLEAMACGKPLIASNVGGIPDIVADHESGILVPPGDVVALRQAIRQLLSNPQLGTQMGQAGKERVALFRADVIIPKIEQIYRHVLTSDIALCAG